MPTVAVVGAQWGDEGKGKVTDFLAEQADVVARFGGGSNAGHTVRTGDTVYKLHLVPSGILYPGTLCVIGNGVVLDPAALRTEVETLQAQGVDVSGLRVSDRAHVVMPYHHVQDRLEEESRGANRLGTTGRGIGPAYADKVARIGIRVHDLLDAEALRSRLSSALEHKNRYLQKMYGHEGFSFDEIFEMCRGYGEWLRPMVTDTSSLVWDAYTQGKRILFEGAQATFLDIDHGTYPYVTSSWPTAGGISPGLGIGPAAVERVIGVIKAYSTRVGEGPFPTELHDETAHYIRERGREYGTTTGRPRRCGWLDLVMVRYAVRINGMTGLAIMLLDVLSGLDELKVCVGYRYGGQRLDHFPASLRVLQACEPIWETLPGWREDLSGVRSYADLPVQARRYLDRIAEVAGVPISMVSVGPEREQTLVLRPPFAA